MTPLCLICSYWAGCLAIREGLAVLKKKMSTTDEQEKCVGSAINRIMYELSRNCNKIPSNKIGFFMGH